MPRIKCGGILSSSPLCISSTIEAIDTPNLDRLNLFVMFLIYLTDLTDFLVNFRAMIGRLEAKDSCCQRNKRLLACDLKSVK